MRRAAADDHAERDRRIRPGRQRRLGDDRQLEAARHRVLHDSRTGRLEGPPGALEQAVSDAWMPGAVHDRDGEVAAVDAGRLRLALGAHDALRSAGQPQVAVGEEVPHPGPLRLEVAPFTAPTPDDERHPLGHLHVVGLDLSILSGLLL